MDCQRACSSIANVSLSVRERKIFFWPCQNSAKIPQKIAQIRANIDELGEANHTMKNTRPVACGRRDRGVQGASSPRVHFMGMMAGAGSWLQMESAATLCVGQSDFSE